MCFRKNEMDINRFSHYPPFEGEAVYLEARVENEDIAVLCRYMDLYEGVAFVRTKDPRRSIVEFWVAPSFVEDFRKIIAALEKEIRMVMLDKEK